MKDTLAIIAGNGELPYLLASSALEESRPVLAIALSREAERRLETLKIEIYRYAPVEVYSILNLLQRKSIQELVFIGKVPKLEFFKSLHRLDSSLMQKLHSLPDLHDDTLHYALLDFIEKEHGLRIADQTHYLRKYFPPAQNFTKRQISAEELSEIRYGLSIAKTLGSLDIGQTAVIQNKSVLAVESIEGTNACIKRARALVRWSPNPRVIVCKSSKPNQDPRFDVPTVGLQTLRSMGKGDILAIEASETMFLNQKEAITRANQNNIAIISVKI